MTHNLLHLYHGFVFQRSGAAALGICMLVTERSAVSFVACGIAAKALPNTLRDDIIIPVSAALSFGRVDEKITQETLSNWADV